MTDFKIGDAVTGIDNSSVYLVVSVTDEYGILRFEGDAPSFSYLPHELQHAVTVPAWIVQWREENMPQEGFEPLETPVDTEKSTIPYGIYSAQYDTIVKLRGESVDLVEQVEALTQEARNDRDAYEKLLSKMQERDDENIQLCIEARNDCDNIELLNAAITEFREEKEAHIKRFHEAERDLKSATTTRDASIQTAGALLEALSSVRKELKIMTGWRDGALVDSNLWCAEYHQVCNELSDVKKERTDEVASSLDYEKLKEELAAEKAFNAAEKEQAAAKFVNAELSNALGVVRKDFAEAKKEIEGLSDLLVKANNETHMSQVALTARTAERDHLKHESSQWRASCERARAALAKWQSACAKSNEIKRELYNTVQAVKNAVGCTDKTEQ